MKQGQAVSEMANIVKDSGERNVIMPSTTTLDTKDLLKNVRSQSEKLRSFMWDTETFIQELQSTTSGSGLHSEQVEDLLIVWDLLQDSLVI